MKLKEWVVFTALGIIWGTSFLWIKIAVAETGPIVLVGFRLLFGLLGLSVVMLLRRQAFPRDRRVLLAFAFMGVFNTAVPFFLITWGETRIDSSLASILNGTVPLFTIVIAHFWLRDEKITLPRIAGQVRFEHVTFGYNPENPVLHDINFEAEPGQMVALVGATGSGKSSIISLIARFYQPQQGRILVDGHDIRHVQGESLNRQTGLVLQVNYLFSGTVMENIRYGREGATDADVIAAARAIGSYDAIMSLTAGFQSEVGERGASMSLGQRQLICFTRAFLADPRIFMLDEATSAVDTATEMLIQESLEKLLEGRTTFIVAHRLSTILRADQILVIDRGRIVERGTHRELLHAGGRYAQ